MTDETIIRVTYPDGSNRETTIKELRDFFTDETKEWQQWFFETLVTYHKARSYFAEYRLMSE